MSRFTVVDAEQRSEAWRAARAGRATGSKADCILAKIKVGEAAARRDYKMQLAIERLIGEPQDGGYVNAEMQRGIDLEPAAIATWEAETGLIARRTGFVAMNEQPVGCSVDGDVDNFTGIIEVKAPKTATHVTYMKMNRVPPEYVPQCTHNLWVTGAKYVDFVSYDDRLPEGLDYFRVRAYREEFDIPAYEAEVLKFLSEVESEVKMLNSLKKRQRLAA